MYGKVWTNACNALWWDPSDATPRLVGGCCVSLGPTMASGIKSLAVYAPVSLKPLPLRAGTTRGCNSIKDHTNVDAPFMAPGTTNAGAHFCRATAKGLPSAGSYMTSLSLMAMSVTRKDL
eukprot:scaffold731_cov261-Pinguiococcus_pyrenoidosus.AAC.52